MRNIEESPDHSQSLSTDDGGWSTGSGSSSTRSEEDSMSSSYVTGDVETSLDQDDIEPPDEETSEEISGSGRKSIEYTFHEETTTAVDIIGASQRTGASYDDIEDFSDWVSDSEIVSSKNNLFLPNLEKSPDEDASMFHFELTPSRTNHQYSPASRDENLSARFQMNSIRETFEEEDVFIDIQDPDDQQESIQDDSYTESEESYSPEPVSSSARDGSYSTSKERSETSSDLFILSSSSINTSGSRDRTTGISPESSKSTSYDTSSAAGSAVLSSSIASSDNNLPLQNVRPRRRRRPRPSQNPGNLTVASSTNTSNTLRRDTKHDSSSSHSGSTNSQTRPFPSNKPRRKPKYSSARNVASTRELRPRKPGSYQKRPSPQKFKSNLAEIAEVLREPSVGSKKTTEKLKSMMESSPKTNSPKHIKSSTRPRQDVHSETRDLKESPSSSQSERHDSTGNQSMASSDPQDPILSPFVFSKSVAFLKDFDCGLKTTTKRIHATINNEGYKLLIEKTYHKLLEIRPRLKYLLSLAEWLHVHMLLLYARVFECELHYYNIALPGEFQIAVPDKIMVFEPIAAAISSIGIVEEPDIGVTYIPVARSIRGNDVYKPHNKDDVTEFLEWTQYDWNASWYQVEKERLERRMMAVEKNMKIPQPDKKFNESRLEDWQQLVVEKWLGWDDDLWFSYMQACFVLDRIGHFVPFPKDGSKKGNYAWLLPRETNDEGTFVRLPRPNLSHECWMIAAMIGFCALKPTATSTWYHETNRVENVQHLMNCFLSAAMVDTSIETTIADSKDK